jgi:hypothetical protein
MEKESFVGDEVDDEIDLDDEEVQSCVICVRDEMIQEVTMMEYVMH